MYGHWASLDLSSSVLTVTPFNKLPVERESPPPTPEQIRKQKEYIKTLVDRPNYELEFDDDAMDFVRVWPFLLRVPGIH